MSSLTPGIVNKLLHGMQSGAHNPIGDHRTALLQVTDIVPVDLDEKALWPKHGFYLKLSDSTDSVYTSLPSHQSDLVMSNKIQLGQFINLDRLEPALPVPVIAGCRPLPGRHPLVGTPDPVRMSSRIQRRGSWDPLPGEGLGQIGTLKPGTLDFGEKTPAKDFSKVLRKSCVIPKMVPSRSKSVTDRAARVPRSPFPDDKSSVDSTPGTRSVKRSEKSPKVSSFTDEIEKHSAIISVHKSRQCSQVNAVISTPVSRSKRVDSTSVNSLFVDEKEADLFSDEKERDKSGSLTRCKNLFSAQDDSEYSSPSKQGCSGTHLSLPGKLSTLGKDAIQKRDAAQKAAHKALRDASATENVVRILKMLSDVNRVAKPENPSPCFEKFLSFHDETIQAIKDIETIQAATSMCTNTRAAKNASDLDSSILQEVGQNTRTPCKKRPIFKGTPDPNRVLVLNQNTSNTSVPDDVSETSLKMVREIQQESATWFVEFLDLALESGLKKTGGNGSGRAKKAACVCPQSLMLRVVNWIEIEQKGDDGKRRHVHPKASQIARKLRIKAKNN